MTDQIRISRTLFWARAQRSAGLRRRLLQVRSRGRRPRHFPQVRGECRAYFRRGGLRDGRRRRVSPQVVGLRHCFAAGGGGFLCELFLQSCELLGREDNLSSITIFLRIQFVSFGGSRKCDFLLFLERGRPFCLGVLVSEAAPAGLSAVLPCRGVGMAVLS